MSCRRAVTFIGLWLSGLLLPALLVGCAVAPGHPDPLNALLPADVLLLGEQHDAPDHQSRQRAVLQTLQASGQLAALVIEMAEQGATTEGLSADASEIQVRQAMGWPASEAAGWDWAVYGPLVMQAVRAGTPVWGGNLPRAAGRSAMQDSALDARLSASAWAAQQTQIREGHCGLLPESQVLPMARIQVARDLAMARTAQAAMRPGQTVLLVAGNQHVRRDLGVPAHWAHSVRATTVIMAAGPTAESAGAQAADHIWRTPALPERDHCAEFKAQMMKR